MSRQLLAALAGQPNCGKSTLFNMLTGARQHVANYPGVTVEKKTGYFSIDNTKVELVDLPGTYSLTSYSLEERAARDFLLHNKPQVTVNILDASNIKRSLYLTLQLIEMEVPLVLAVNMSDVASRRGIRIDLDGLADFFALPIVKTIGTKGIGMAELKQQMQSFGTGKACVSSYKLDYGKLEPFIADLEKLLASYSPLEGACSMRWLAIKLLEDDAGAHTILTDRVDDCSEIYLQISHINELFQKENPIPVVRHIAFTRHRTAASITTQFVKEDEPGKATLSDKADRIICNKYAGPVILLLILIALYHISITCGNYLAAMIWPMWDTIQTTLAEYLPASGFLEDPLLRSLGIWSMKSMTALFNYLPIFFLLFICIAILEDSGYMPRMAFILDRVFRRFGLHGQSTLPLILGGIYVGGCAIPAVMATRAIPDEKARLATILIAPMMNCLAKVPLYLILISTFFPTHQGAAMFFIATVTLFMALPVSKLLSMTVLKGKPSAPFIMEMPPYHLPTIRGVLTRTVERLWLFIKKITTVVLAVAIVVFALISFPQLDADQLRPYQQRADVAIAAFLQDVQKTSLASSFSETDIDPLLRFEDTLKNAKLNVTQEKAVQIDQEFEQRNPVYFSIVRGSNQDGKALRRSLRNLGNERKQLRRELKEELFENSILGLCGRALEPVTQYAGFNWKVNIALLSAFAAKENSAATLGAIYGADEGDGSVQQNILEGEPGFTPLHALALMIFMALYPPCIPTSIMVRLQAGSTGWMFFSIFYQTFLGLFLATLIFTGGSLLKLSGWETMWLFYGLCVLATLLLGLIPENRNVSAMMQKSSTAPVAN